MLRINSSVSSGVREGPSTRCKIPCTRIVGGVFTRMCKSEAPSETTNCSKSDIEYDMLNAASYCYLHRQSATRFITPRSAPACRAEASQRRVVPGRGKLSQPTAPATAQGLIVPCLAAPADARAPTRKTIFLTVSKSAGSTSGLARRPKLRSGESV